MAFSVQRLQDHELPRRVAGYAPRETEALLREAAENYEWMWENSMRQAEWIRTLEAEVQRLGGRLHEVRESSTRAGSILSEADAEAKAMLEAARAEAEAARAEATRILAVARTEADGFEQETRSLHEDLLAEVAQLSQKQAAETDALRAAEEERNRLDHEVDRLRRAAELAAEHLTALLAELSELARPAP